MALQVGMVLTGDSSDANRALQATETSLDEVGKAAKRCGMMIKLFGDGAEGEFKQLKSSMDPVYRAQLAIERKQAEMNKALKAGAVTQAEATRLMQQYTAATNNGAASSRKMASQVTANAKSQRRFGMAVQNTSYQVGDFAVQVGMGVDVSRALAMQLPQLLGGFGVLGALLGAVVAIAVPLWEALFATGDAAESAAEPLDELTNSVKSYRAAAQDADSSTADLISTYGTASEAVRELLGLQEDLALRQAKVDLGTAISSLLDTGSIGEQIAAIKEQISRIDFADTISPSGKMNIADLAASYAELGDSLGVTQQQAKDLVDALDATAAAGSAEEQLRWLNAIRDGYLGLVGDVADLTDAQAEFLQKIKTAELEAQTLVATVGGIAPEISAAADQADRLTGALRNANAESFLYSRRFADEEALMNMPLEIAGNNRPPKATPARGAAGGGGGGGAAASQVNAADKLIDKLQQEIDLLGELDPLEQEMIRLRGQLGDATAAETEKVRELITERNAERAALEQTISRLDGLRDGARSVFDTIIEGARQGTSALDIMLNILFDIGSKLTSLAGDSLIDALFGSSGSASGGAIGGGLSDLFSSIFKFADGGVVNAPTLFGYGSGQTGLMGEAGPEAIMPLTHGGKSGVGASLGGRETTLPLTRLGSGKLGVAIQPFAKGGAFGSYATPVATTAPTQAAFGRGGATVVNNWNIRTDNPRSFAESKATTARAGSRLMGNMGRYT